MNQNKKNKYFSLKKILKKTDPKDYFNNIDGIEYNEGITVLIVNWFEKEHLENNFNSLINNAEKPEQLSFIIIDNTNGKDTDLVNLDFKKLKIIRRDHEGLTSGINASVARNLGFSMVTTKYCLVLHPDTIVLEKNWDRSYIINYIRNKINENQIAQEYMNEYLMFSEDQNVSK